MLNIAENQSELFRKSIYDEYFSDDSFPLIFLGLLGGALGGSGSNVNNIDNSDSDQKDKKSGTDIIREKILTKNPTDDNGGSKSNRITP